MSTKGKPYKYKTFKEIVGDRNKTLEDKIKKAKDLFTYLKGKIMQHAHAQSVLQCTVPSLAMMEAMVWRPTSGPPYM